MREPGKIKQTSSVVVGREKSLNDIYNQRDRAIAAANGDRARIERISEITSRYAGNIRQSEEYAFDRLPLNQRAREAFAAARAKGYKTGEEANQDKELTRRYGRFEGQLGGAFPATVTLPGLFGRKYSQNTYMGRRNNRN